MIDIKKYYKTDLFKIFVYGSNTIINRFLGFLLLIIITNNLNQEVVGQYFIFLNIQSILVSISMLGLPHLIIKELSLNLKKKIKNNLPAKIFLFSLIFSFSAFILLSIIFYFVYTDLGFIFFIFISSLLTIFNSIFLYFFIAGDKILYANFLEQILKYSLIIFSILFLIFFHFSIKVEVLILVYIFANLIITFCFIFSTLTIFKLGNLRDKENIQISLKKYTRYSFIVGLSGIFVILNSKIDILMIEYFLDEIQVSIYGVGVQLAFIAYMPTIVFAHILMTKLSSLVKKEKFIQLNITLDIYRSLLVFINLLIFLIAIFIVEHLIIFFFGVSYKISDEVFNIIIIGYVIGSIFSFNDIYLNYIGGEKKVMLMVCFSSILNILLNLIFIPKLGILGAAISLSISHVTFNLLTFANNLKNNYFFISTLKILTSKKSMLSKILTI